MPYSSPESFHGSPDVVTLHEYSMNICWVTHFKKRSRFATEFLERLRTLWGSNAGLEQLGSIGWDADGATEFCFRLC